MIQLPRVDRPDGNRPTRNNNPLNIEFHANTVWAGLDLDNPTDGRFCRFTNPAYGYRAGAKILSGAYAAAGRNTIDKIIAAWAPSTENATDLYQKVVAGITGLGRDKPLNLRDPAVVASIIHAMSIQEGARETLACARQGTDMVLGG